MAMKDQQPASESAFVETDETLAGEDAPVQEDTSAHQDNGAEADTPLTSEVLSPETLQEQLAEQRRQTEQYLDHLQRLQAEFTNYRRRVSQEQLQATSRGKENVLRALLPILGNLRLAVHHAQEDANAVRQGVQMIWQQFENFLREQGVEQVATVGQPFDPTKHEALSTAPATVETPANTVVAEINAGYSLDGRLLRPAQVVVARAGEATETPAPGEPTEPPPSIDIQA